MPGRGEAQRAAGCGVGAWLVVYAHGLWRGGDCGTRLADRIWLTRVAGVPCDSRDDR